MQLLPSQARLPFALGIIAAFFAPSYNGISGFRLVRLVFEMTNQHRMDTTDALIVLAPVVSLPVAATFVFVQAVRLKHIAIAALALPLLQIILFAGILMMTDAGSTRAFRNPDTFLKMQPGFYVLLLCAAFLIFTKDPCRKKRQRQTSSSILSTAHPTAADAP